MSRRYEIKDIPEHELEAQIKILKQDGATEVTSKRQPNGKYTIVAIYPE
ncbi:hypothetical protein [Pseudoalteromonas rubra]|nr:hypothetical protein [Pseudoalteromonas rubra]